MSIDPISQLAATTTGLSGSGGGGTAGGTSGTGSSGDSGGATGTGDTTTTGGATTGGTTDTSPTSGTGAAGAASGTNETVTTRREVPLETPSRATAESVFAAQGLTLSETDEIAAARAEAAAYQQQARIDAILDAVKEPVEVAPLDGRRAEPVAEIVGNPMLNPDVDVPGFDQVK